MKEKQCNPFQFALIGIIVVVILIWYRQSIGFELDESIERVFAMIGLLIFALAIQYVIMKSYKYFVEWRSGKREV